MKLNVKEDNHHWTSRSFGLLYLCLYCQNGDGNVSRFGFVNKEGEYSSHTVFKEKMMVYSDACSIADRYLKECVLYLKECGMPLYNGEGKLKSNRTVFV